MDPEFSRVLSLYALWKEGRLGLYEEQNPDLLACFAAVANAESWIAWEQAEDIRRRGKR